MLAYMRYHEIHDILLFSYHLPPGFAMAPSRQVSDLYTLALLTGGPQAKLVPLLGHPGACLVTGTWLMSDFPNSWDMLGC